MLSGASTEFPVEWGETEQSGDAHWRLSTLLVDVPLDATEAGFLAKAVALHCPSSTLEKVTRVQNRGLWQSYRCVRGRVLLQSCDPCVSASSGACGLALVGDCTTVP